MSKKFIFNPNSLEFELKKTTLKEFIKNFLTHTFISLLLGTLLGYLVYINFETFEQKSIQKLNNQIAWNIKYVGEKIASQQSRVTKLEYYDNFVYRAILGLKSKSSIPFYYAIGGSVDRNEINLLQTTQDVKEYQIISNLIKNKIKVQSKSFIYIKNDIKEKENKYASIPYISPLERKNIERIGSNVGIRIHPILKIPLMHTGLDISAAMGTPVYATGDGIIVTSGWNNGYGLCIKINHGYNYQTIYAHLSKIIVSEGQIVKRGQLIGYVGNTGRSTAAHLHYEVRIAGKPMNPLKFMNDISDEQFSQIVDSSTEKDTFKEM